MGTNPRKFSEKIALHKQRQDEEQAAFEKIMSEVQAAKVVPSVPTMPSCIPLPNNRSVSPAVGMPSPRPTGPPVGLHLNPNNLSNSFRGGGSLPNVAQMAQDKGSHVSRSHGLYGQSLSPRSSRNSIGPVRVNANRRNEHSPYASPPNMTSMMMTQSMANHSNHTMQQNFQYGNNSYLSPPPEGNWRRANSDSALNSLMIPLTVPHGDSSGEDSSNNSNDIRDGYNSSNNNKNHDGGQLNNLNLIQMPITIVDPNNPNNLLEIPTSVSTGSLPDLTQFQFPPPLQQPIDLDDSQQNNQSPYSTSPLTGSGYSSPHPPSHQQQQQHQQPNSPQQQQQRQQQQQQQQQQNHQVQISQNQQQMLDNPLQINSFQNFSPNDNNNLTTYRNPQRPSPQNSPSPFRSASPLLDGGLQLSAPSSPNSQQNTNQNQNDESYFLSQQAQQQLQQHFQNSLSMMETPERNNWQGGVASNYNYYNQSSQQIPTGQTPTQNNQNQSSPQNPQTPQTPSSIPDIIFTDFSEVRGNDQGLLVDDFLREGLGSIDMDGFSMLQDPDLIPLDPHVEDSFRLDRL